MTKPYAPTGEIDILEREWEAKRQSHLAPEWTATPREPTRSIGYTIWWLAGAALVSSLFNMDDPWSSVGILFSLYAYLVGVRRIRWAGSFESDREEFLYRRRQEQRLLEPSAHGGEEAFRSFVRTSEDYYMAEWAAETIVGGGTRMTIDVRGCDTKVVYHKDGEVHVIANSGVGEDDGVLYNMEKLKSLGGHWWYYHQKSIDIAFPLMSHIVKGTAAIEHLPGFANFNIEVELHTQPGDQDAAKAYLRRIKFMMEQYAYHREHQHITSAWM
ncbi:MAG: hypothetical protein ACRC1K_14080 [Planctomycetia bacterium]